MIEYSWHQKNWQKLNLLRQADRIPHALLLTGNAGLGKSDFALRLVQANLCSEPDINGDSCGHCHNCHLVQAGSHPDIVCIDPENDGEIKVDDVRDYTSKEGLKPQIAVIKMLLINRIERMNRSSFNSFLKTLEEPVASSRIILTTNKPGALPATIRSRCQTLVFNPPDSEQLSGWLQKNGVNQQRVSALTEIGRHNPLLALSLNDETQWETYLEKLQQFKVLLFGQSDVFGMAESWAKFSLKPTLDMLFFWLLSIAQFRATQQEQYLHVFQDLKPAVSQINLNKLNELISQLVNISPTMNLNAQLFWEDVFFKLTDLTLKAKR